MDTIGNAPEKKTVTLRGAIVWPIAVGACALLISGERFIRTSRVVAIQENTAERVRFETLHTHYCVELDPFPLAAASPVPMGAMAA